jgi:hypothetical protein
LLPVMSFVALDPIIMSVRMSALAGSAPARVVMSMR